MYGRASDFTRALCDGGDTHTDTSHPIHTPGSITGPGPPPEPPAHHPLGGQGGGHGHFKGHYAQPYSPRSIPQLPKKEKNHKKKRKITKNKKGAVPQHAPRACRNVRAQQKPRAAASRVPAGGFCWHSKVTPGAGYFLPRRCCAGKLLPELEPRSWGLVSDPDNPRVSVRTLMGRQGNELRWIAPLCFAFRGSSRAGFKANSAPFAPFSGLGEAFLRQDLGEEAA